MVHYNDMFQNLPLYCSDKPYPVDKNDLCEIAVQSLLIISADNKILIDTGIGNTIDQTILDSYHYRQIASLDELLSNYDLIPEDITDIILTHLHFDHCGGSVVKNHILKPAFPNATHWVGKEHWDWAQHKERREENSYSDLVLENLFETGNLKFVGNEGEIMPGISVRFYHGHTRGLMIPFIENRGETIVFAGDLIPTSAHIPLSNIMTYDIDPDLTRREKQNFLIEASAKNYTLYFQHDLFRTQMTLI